MLAAVAPEIGMPRTVNAAPRLALAIGYELDIDVEPDFDVDDGD